MREIFYNKDYVNADDGVFFARGVFETILVKKEPIFLKEHMQRLNKGIKELLIGEEVSLELIQSEIEKRNIKDTVLKIIVTPKNIILKTRDFPYKEEDYLNGFKVSVSDVLRNSTSKLNYIKSINYIENLIENQNAKRQGYNEVLFLNEKGLIAEGSTSNIFIVKNNRVFTPKVSAGLLDGVVRRFIIQNFSVIECELSLKDILESEEVFLTNSLLGVMPVSKIQEVNFNIINNTNNIRKAYEEEIRKLGGA